MLSLLLAVVLVQTPDGRGEVGLREPVHQGVRASAPIPANQHVKNEGGSNGAGLCVIASIVANGAWQGVPGAGTPDANGDYGHGSRLWQAAKKRPGGYYPQKLAALVEEVLPTEKWASYIGRDPAILDTLSSKGYPIGATMNTGALYNYRPIHHMVSLVHYRSGQWACVVDNNQPGVFSWMPAAEFARRWVDGATGWAWIWTRLPLSARVGVSAAVLVWLAAALVIVGTWARRKAVG